MFDGGVLMPGYRPHHGPFQCDQCGTAVGAEFWFADRPYCERCYPQVSQETWRLDAVDSSR